MSSVLRALANCVVKLAAAGTVVVAAFTLGGFAAKAWWRSEQVCHFRVQYFALLSLAAAVLWIGRRPQVALLALAMAIVNLASIVPIYWPLPRAASQGMTLRVISFNVLSSNKNQAQTLEFLRQERADLVLLMEITDTWAASLEKLNDLYPYRLIEPREDNFGVALLSRTPWRAAELVHFGNAGVPSVVGKFALGDGEWVFVGTHPLPPGSRQMAALRNSQLSDVAQFVRNRQTVIVAGDLNVSGFTPYFHDVLREGRLNDSRQGRGIQASWGPVPLMEIAIDHVLVSSNIAVLNRRVGPHLGSDHRPVIVELRLPTLAAD